jgi:sec-independent protein translocase protein TatA
MGPVGVQEMIVIFLVALVLFGPKKLPELGRTIGKALTEFRRAQSELKSTFETHMRELEKENESVKDVTRSFTSDLYNHFDSNFYDSNGGYNAAESNPSTAASPSTVGASATSGAESTGTAPGHGVTGAVARNAPEQLAGNHPEPSEAGAEPHSVNS